MATRRGFDPSVDPSDAIDEAPGGAQRSGGCFADGCTMPGTISVGGKTWCCAWHHGVLPTDIPRVTQVLRDWECLTYEINIGRRVLTGPHACDPKAQNKAFAEAVRRVGDATGEGGWGDRFEHREGQDYRAWLLGLERFLGGRVLIALGYANAEAVA